MRSAAVPRPIVKWAGGKRGLTERLLRWMPPAFDTYAEPFCGGAAVFFALAAERPRRYRRAILADKNVELICCYRAIQSDVDAMVERLRRYRDEHLSKDAEARREHFYAVRALETASLSDVERGARLVFLNKTCFNGLWRVNAKGRFNVPFGRYASPKILDEEGLRAAHDALRGVSVREADFGDVTRKLKAGDFAYFDPPYVPASATANFTAYAKDPFGPNEQARLAKVLAELGERGVRAMLSNTCSPETEALYAGFRRERVPVPRSINSDPAKRGEVDELVVMNYESEAVTSRPARGRKAAS